ncbi:DUF805 domain-containing protein [Maribacter algarum]|uniref:DUF805 domain-containing protein n=1 Tax=Maribacter algarum (ex Zhang et al. 2020) TaxID=2578118 RepID=A0A5S3PP30_9FLAO|nr:DUF805 domain-containing protein [Maribacter algarum]TMM56249.1 DUF805 domain-containing protein [Maribacter algarum]
MNWYLKVLKQYADFKGRARRKEYWMFFLFNIIISYGITFIALGLEMPELSIVSTIYSLAVLIPGIAVGVRRMHDVGKSGWYLLIPIYSLILACTDSEEGPNKWGPNPKNPNTELDDIGVAEA